MVNHQYTYKDSGPNLTGIGVPDQDNNHSDLHSEYMSWVKDGIDTHVHFLATDNWEAVSEFFSGRVSATQLSNKVYKINMEMM